MTSTLPPPSDRCRIRRMPERADYSPEQVKAILAEAYVAHLAFQDGDSVHSIPMSYWPDDDYVYIHCAHNARLVKALTRQTVCLSVALVDGLVLASAAKYHSMNYRSVVLYGQFEEVAEADKAQALDRLMRHITPERADQIRPADAEELALIRVLRMPIHEAACKQRSGGPRTRPADLGDPRWSAVWTGVIPLSLLRGEPIPAS